MEIVLTYPAYSQGVIEDDFLHTVLRHFEQLSAEGSNTYSIVPILNGMSNWDYARSLQQYEGISNTIAPTYSGTSGGLFGALLHGYRHTASRYRTRNATIVRMDTAEHPVSAIMRLARQAEKSGGMIVGDLCFDGTTLLEGTPDWYAHKMVWPNITRMLNRQDLSLSCAHGFQAFGPGVLPDILTQLDHMVTYLSDQGITPSWGLDFGMVCGALLGNVPIEVCPVPAETLSNRGLVKIADQLSAAAAWVSAYAHIRK